jgi:serine/threonine protein kinase
VCVSASLVVDDMSPTSRMNGHSLTHFDHDRGAFGIVHRVQDKSKNLFAMKTVKKKQGKMYEQLVREVEIMKSVQHKNIVELKCVYESSKKMWIVMEL